MCVYTERWYKFESVLPSPQTTTGLHTNAIYIYLLLILDYLRG